jgi:hypothetical protein
MAAISDDQIWRAEEQFWTGDEIRWRTMLDPQCVMGFPAPAGIMSGAAIVTSLAEAPRWSSVDMNERHIARPEPDLVVIGYRARGRRADAEPYTAYCTSSYRATTSGWKLFQHHQTPIA